MKNKLFGTHTGLPASELILGAASFGERRGYGSIAEDIPRILGAYTDAGGNLKMLLINTSLGKPRRLSGSLLNRNEAILLSVPNIPAAVK
jgi:hypothetical protein